MIYLFTALYCEAHALIRQFGLTRNLQSTWPQEFHSEEAGIRLIITGVGEIAAAAAVGSTCGVYRPAREDVLLNVGLCACGEEKSGIFLCNKITEQATGKTFYPDMLYRQDFPEASLITGMRPYVRGAQSCATETWPYVRGMQSCATETGPWKGERDCTVYRESFSGGTLYDMEAAAIYQAGSEFFGPHQMIFLKIVSDRGAAEEVTKEQAERLTLKYGDALADFIRRIQMCIQKSAPGEEEVLRMQEELTEKLSGALHCSRAMRDSLRECLRYMTLSGADYTSVIQDMYEKGLLPCRDKREGKLRFEELKRRVL